MNLNNDETFTEVEGGVNGRLNNLTVTCIESSNNNFSLDSEGNLIVKSITTENQNEDLILDKIYPVGSIYMSINATNPTDYFGGTWEQIQNRFLLGVGTNYISGSTGGAEGHIHSTNYHTLSVDEIPSHAHTTSYSNWSGKQGTGFAIAYTNIEGTNNAKLTNFVGGNQGHSHGDTGYSSNMPPYLAVYMWKRVA